MDRRKIQLGKKWSSTTNNDNNIINKKTPNGTEERPEMSLSLGQWVGHTDNGIIFA